jgi:aminoglycoside phosphotransferase (APT) family kinase protein
MAGMHDAEIEVDEPLVRDLLASLSPAYAGLPLRRFTPTGSTNALFRLGDDLLVRVPRQPGGTATIEKEQRWLPYVAPVLPVRVPQIVATGAPAAGYPEKWSLVRFLQGETPTVPAPSRPPRHALARDLAQVVTGLRSLEVPPAASADPALRWYRGRPLADLDDELRRLLADCREMAGLGLDVDAVERAWDEAVALPAPEGDEPLWHHGDLVAENLLTRDGRLVAVLDFGCLSVGRPAVDLVVAWELLDPAARGTFRASVGVDDVEWGLGRGWALALAIMALPYYWHSMPERCVHRLAMVRAVLDDVGHDGPSGP